jgi:hypothetical protein
MEIAGWLFLPAAYEWIGHERVHAFCESFEIRFLGGTCLKHLLDVVDKDSDGILLVHVFLSFNTWLFLTMPSFHSYSTTT